MKKTKVTNGLIVLIIILVVVFGAAYFFMSEDSSEELEESDEPAQINQPAIQSAKVDESAQEVFTNYRKSLEDNSFSNFKRYILPDMITVLEADLGSPITDSNFNKLSSLLTTIFPPANQVIVTKETRTGKNLIWEVRDSRDTNSKGVIEFSMEYGIWKIKSENWETSS